MKRYHFLKKEAVYEALNKLRAAFLAAKDGNEVESIIKAVLTNDERMKIGRRIQIAELLKAGLTHMEVKAFLKVGFPTIAKVDKKISENPEAFELINKREKKVEDIYQTKAYVRRGSSKMVFKKKEYTGFKRKDVKR